MNLKSLSHVWVWDMGQCHTMSYHMSATLGFS